MLNYTKIKVVGKGAHGVATLYKRNKDDKLVVVKQLFEVTEQDQQEIQVLSMLRHPNIIGYLDSFTESTMLMIVMEYADCGTLDDYIRAQKLLLQESTVLSYFVQICFGIHHIHQHNILHRDLKPNNILIGQGQILKVSDFGISKLLSSKKAAQTVVGTPSYLSPELCEGKSYNNKSDIWSMGCILAELLCLKKYFEASNLPALVLKIMRGAHEQIPAQYSSDLVRLVNAMCTIDPTKRPDMNEIVGVPFLQDSIVEAQMSLGRPMPLK